MSFPASFAVYFNSGAAQQVSYERPGVFHLFLEYHLFQVLDLYNFYLDVLGAVVVGLAVCKAGRPEDMNCMPRLADRRVIVIDVFYLLCPIAGLFLKLAH